MKIKVAVLQYDVPLSTSASINKLVALTAQAAKQGAKLVVAPETAVGEAMETKTTGVDHLESLADIAQQSKVYLATSYYRRVGKKFLNRGVIVAPDGKLVVEHVKVYPAKPEIKNLGVESGKNLKAAKTTIGTLGMIICKDGFNRYSHFLYEKLWALKVEIICVPAWSIGWKEINTQEYIKSLYVYGAFASRAFLLMADCINKPFDAYGGSFGRSLIVSPIQGVLKEGSVDKEEILIEELDLDEVKNAREFDSWWQPEVRKL